MAELTEKKSFLVFFIIVISVFCATSLAFMKEYLKERIKLNQTLEEKKTILNTLKIKYDEHNVRQIEDILKNNIKNKINGTIKYSYENHNVTSKKILSEDELKKEFGIDSIDKITKEVNGLVYYEYVVNGKLKAYVFYMQGPGLWGTMKAYIAMSADLKKIMSLRFFEHEETPGLGGRISDVDYISKFDGTVVNTPEHRDIVITRNASKPNEVDSITGATITSNRVEDLINSMLAKIRKNFKIGSDMNVQ